MFSVTRRDVHPQQLLQPNKRPIESRWACKLSASAGCAEAVGKVNWARQVELVLRLLVRIIARFRGQFILPI